MPTFTSRKPRLIIGAATLALGAALAMPSIASADEEAEPNRVVLNDDSLTATPAALGTAITFTRPAEYDYCVTPNVHTGFKDASPRNADDLVYPLEGDDSGRFIVTQEEYDAIAGTDFEGHFTVDTHTITLPLRGGDYSAVGYCVTDQGTEDSTEVDYIRHFTVSPVAGSLAFGSAQLVGGLGSLFRI